ncbi:MAG: chitobiase/beta-hexosaminidase C-terminal domain-containing protein, partial [Paramuribaculum sp.]|nr:chitobiase/beta-hexosaminidase C-terminal domain-containing protein [Paramuribaculum sp.]
MKKIFCLITVMLMAVCATSAAERSYTITFGAQSAGTNSLTNDNFVSTCVKQGAAHIAQVTSVVNVFPETDGIKMSSSKKAGKFNIHLAEEAQVVASRIVVSARRFDNDKDSEANIMLNSETLMIPSLDWADYTLSIPSQPQKILTNLIVDAEHRLYIESITIFYDDTHGTVDPVLETVATPVISPAGGLVTAGTAVEISCDTQGATIFYTVDGTLPSSGSFVYEGPITVSNDMQIKAFAAKDGMTPSEVASATFAVRTPEATLTAFFDFSNPQSLTP